MVLVLPVFLKKRYPKKLKKVGNKSELANKFAQLSYEHDITNPLSEKEYRETIGKIKEYFSESDVAKLARLQSKYDKAVDSRFRSSLPVSIRNNLEPIRVKTAHKNNKEYDRVLNEVYPSYSNDTIYVKDKDGYMREIPTRRLAFLALNEYINDKSKDKKDVDFREVIVPHEDDDTPEMHNAKLKGDTYLDYFKEHAIEDTDENIKKYISLKESLESTKRFYRQYLAKGEGTESDAGGKMFQNAIKQKEQKFAEWKKYAELYSSKYLDTSKYIYNPERLTTQDLKYDLEHYNKEANEQNIAKYRKLKEDAINKYEAQGFYVSTVDFDKYSKAHDDHLWEEYEKAEKKRKDFLENSTNNRQSDSANKNNSSIAKQQKSKIKALKSSGLSYAEIAKRLGISEGSVSYYLNS